MPKAGKKKELVDPRPQIEVGPTHLLAALDEQRRNELELQARRISVASEIARYRWTIGKDFHALKDGVTRLDFERYPFQTEIYQDPAADIVFYGASQFGKSEFLICDAVASAAYGLNVLYVISKYDKRDKFVADRIDPAFSTNRLYNQFVEQAKQRGAKSDSVRLKHFGPGSINFVAASADRDFTSYSADKATVDEHQECDQNNLRMLDDRMSGTPFGFMVRVGHPTTEGSEESPNLDWLFHNSNQKLWHVPCDTCRKEQVLTWHDHIVHEVRNKEGAIVAIKPRDSEWKPKSKFDIRAICSNCHRPMSRLSRQGRWVEMNPGAARAGYKMSNLYNPYRTLAKMFERYLSDRHQPSTLAEFYNKQLGEPFSMSGNKLTADLIRSATSGSGVQPYRFVPVSHMEWRKILAA